MGVGFLNFTILAAFGSAAFFCAVRGLTSGAKCLWRSLRAGCIVRGE